MAWIVPLDNSISRNSLHGLRCIIKCLVKNIAKVPILGGQNSLWLCSQSISGTEAHDIVLGVNQEQTQKKNSNSGYRQKEQSNKGGRISSICHSSKLQRTSALTNFHNGQTGSSIWQDFELQTNSTKKLEIHSDWNAVELLISHHHTVSFALLLFEFLSGISLGWRGYLFSQLKTKWRGFQGLLYSPSCGWKPLCSPVQNHNNKMESVATGHPTWPPLYNTWCNHRTLVATMIYTVTVPVNNITGSLPRMPCGIVIPTIGAKVGLHSFLSPNANKVQQFSIAPSWGLPGVWSRHGHLERCAETTALITD
ncbi:uncharacterized protein LOC125634958 [Caretta caretta]|uniref:uncharacterized protein LOC125634958 n=1 Tax=Caretta caretta TaxID=8467 RepID=UPI003F4B1C5D